MSGKTVKKTVKTLYLIVRLSVHRPAMDDRLSISDGHLSYQFAQQEALIITS